VNRKDAPCLSDKTRKNAKDLGETPTTNPKHPVEPSHRCHRLRRDLWRDPSAVACGLVSAKIYDLVSAKTSGDETFGGECTNTDQRHSCIRAPHSWSASALKPAL